MSNHPTCLGPLAEVGNQSLAVIDLLDLLRRRTRMDVAGLGRLDGDLMVIQETSGDVRGFGLTQGSSVRRDRSLFGLVLDGALPSLMADTSLDPRTAGLPTVRELGIGAYAVRPVLDADGTIYGLVGCISHEARPSTGAAEVRLLGLLANFLTDHVSDLHQTWERRCRVWHHVHDLIECGGPRIHLQPIIDLCSGQPVAVEALSRFLGSTRPAPQFADATAVGLGPELEMAAIRQALAVLPAVPIGVRLQLNASPTTVTSGLVDVLLSCDAPHRLALEITEHEYVGEDSSLCAAVRALRSRGIDIVLDDMGTGYAGLQLLLRLRPDVVKLDRFIVHGISTDPAHRAVAEGMTGIAHCLGGRVVAEGIESWAELAAVRAAGIDYGQGFLLGHPTPDPQVACRPAPRRAFALTGG
jgi:EAL domain-containing protein (putative c-di-GMP-specific phosphodiesterase class I)